MKFLNIKVIASCKNYFIGQDDKTTYKIYKESIESQIDLNKSYNFYLDDTEIEILHEEHFQILLELEEIKGETLSIKKDIQDNLFLSIRVGSSLTIEAFTKEDFESLDLNDNSKTLYLNVKNILRVKKLRAA